LAHAFFPKDGSTHFDADEDWKFKSNGGTDLEIVAAHEFGHALGLGHSGNQKSLMVPPRLHRSGYCHLWGKMREPKPLLKM
jgi:matrix metalloproteinase-14 (membrane-inserted)